MSDDAKPKDSIWKQFWKALVTPMPRSPAGKRPHAVLDEAMNNFTPRSQQVLALARKEADRFNHNFVGTEHLLLGIIRLQDCTAAKVLVRQGLELETVRAEVEKQIGAGPDQRIVDNIPYTPRVKKVLRLASREARAMNHSHIGTEHILLGLLREGDGVAARVLKNLDISIEETRRQVLIELGDKPWRSASSSSANTPAERPPAKPFRPTASDEMLLNFTPRAQQVLALARKEADHFNHNFVGTEHLLLGLINLGQGVGVTVLKRLGLNLEAVRAEIKSQVGTGPDQKMIGIIPYTPRVKKVLALAAREARALNHTYVGTEHILLGLLRDGGGVAACVLKKFNVDIEQTRQGILKELDPNQATSESTSQSPEKENTAADAITTMSSASLRILNPGFKMQFTPGRTKPLNWRRGRPEVCAIASLEPNMFCSDYSHSATVSP